MTDRPIRSVFRDAQREIKTLKAEMETPDDARRVRIFEELLARAYRTELERDCLELERSLLGPVLERYNRAIRRCKDNPDGESTNARARRLLRDLGLSTGKREKKFDGGMLLYEYMARLRGMSEEEAAVYYDAEECPPMDKWSAIEALTEKYGMSSTASCYQHLKKALAAHNKTCPGSIKNILPWNTDPPDPENR